VERVTSTMAPWRAAPRSVGGLAARSRSFPAALYGCGSMPASTRSPGDVTTLREVVPAGTRAAREAEKVRTRLLAEVDDRRNPRTNATVNQLLDRYLGALEIEDYARRLRNHLAQLHPPADRSPDRSRARLRQALLGSRLEAAARGHHQPQQELLDRRAREQPVEVAFRVVADELGPRRGLQVTDYAEIRSGWARGTSGGSGGADVRRRQPIPATGAIGSIAAMLCPGRSTPRSSSSPSTTSRSTRAPATRGRTAARARCSSSRAGPGRPRGRRGAWCDPLHLAAVRKGYGLAALQVHERGEQLKPQVLRVGHKPDLGPRRATGGSRKRACSWSSGGWVRTSPGAPHFPAVIAAGAANRSDRDGPTTLQMVDAAIEAACTGAPVDVAR